MLCDQNQCILTLLYLSFAKLSPSLPLARADGGVVRDV